MKILVTGATGFLGSRTVEYLAKKKLVSSIIATGRNASSILIYEHLKVSYVFGDLADKRFVQSIFDHDIDYVINCAGLSSPWGSYHKFYLSNVRSQINLLQQSQRTGIKRFIFISSPSIYFDYEDHRNLRESDAIPTFQNQVNNYSLTKLMGETLLKHSGLEYVTLRPRALIGRGDRVIMTRIIKAHKAGQLKIMGDGLNYADLTPVANMVEIIWQSLLAETSTCNQAYNISNGQPVQIWSFINSMFDQLKMQPLRQRISYKLLFGIASLFEWKARIFHKEKEPSITKYLITVLARNFYCDISKPIKQLGYRPKQTIDEALQEFLLWYKQVETKL